MLEKILQMRLSRKIENYGNLIKILVASIENLFLLMHRRKKLKFLIFEYSKMYICTFMLLKWKKVVKICSYVGTSTNKRLYNKKVEENNK